MQLGSFRRLTYPLAVGWLVAVAVMAGSVSAGQWRHIQKLVLLYPSRQSSLRFACFTIAFGVGSSLLMGLFKPHWWRRWCLALLIVPALVLVLVSGNIVAGVVAFGLLTPTVWGARVYTSLLLPDLDRVEAWTVGSAIGVGTLALLGFVLGRGAILRPWSIEIALAIAMALLLLSPVPRQCVRDDLASLWRWSSDMTHQSVINFILAGATIGILWLAYFGALAPEIIADAVRQRLASAALLAQMGRSPVADPDLLLAVKPGTGELIYAVALTVGPLQTAKIFNSIVGVFALLGVWALGRRIGGGQSGFIAALTFATLPLTLWLAQTAYIDLFATLFAISCAIVIIASRASMWRVGIYVLGGVIVGLAVKTSFGSVAVGLLATVAVGTVWNACERYRRIHVIWGGFVSIFAATVLSLILWRVTYSPLAPLRELWLMTSTQFVNYEQFGSGHSLAALFRAPLDLTLHTERYGELQDGAVGYFLLALLPLLSLIRPRKSSILLLIAAIAASLVWFFIAQYVRYALPLLAFWCALAGLAYSAVTTHCANMLQRIALSISLLVLLGSGAIGYLNTMLVYPGDVPFAVVLNRQSEVEYLIAHVPAYSAIQLLNREPGATRAMTTGEYARLYSTVQLSGFRIANYTQDEQELLTYLDEQRFSHILIDRERLVDNWYQFLVFNEQFLRRNTVLIGGDHNAYLYRIVPPSQRGRDQEWARGFELLPNGDFDELKEGVPSGWHSGGQMPQASDNVLPDGTATVIRASPQRSFFTAVPVQPGQRYLLSETVQAVEVSGLSRLQINWLDNANTFIATSIEVVPTSVGKFQQFSMLAVAPENATTAVVYAQAQQGEVWFNRFSLRAVEGTR